MWEELDRTAGFGTVHLATKTVQALREVAERQHRARRVNNLFGEGTSPRLRQVREALEVLGIKSDEVLHHATPRIMYACALAPAADHQLLGIRADKDGHATSLEAIAVSWRERWLLQRCVRQEIVEQLHELRPAGARNLLLRANPKGEQVVPFNV